jgi:hypothetical protein
VIRRVSAAAVFSFSRVQLHGFIATHWDAFQRQEFIRVRLKSFCFPAANQASKVAKEGIARRVRH